MDALFLVKQRIETLTGITLYTGRGGEQETDFGTIKYLPNVSFDQPYVHVDGIHVVLYSENVNTALQAARAVIGDLNNESLAGHPLNDQGDYRFNHIVATARSTEEFSLINEKEVTGYVIDIVVEYVEL